MHQFLCSSVCFHIFHNPMVLGHTTSLEQRAEPTTPLKTHLWHLMTPPHTPFVTAPSSIPWWAVLSCDPDLITHHFLFLLLFALVLCSVNYCVWHGFNFDLYYCVQLELAISFLSISFQFFPKPNQHRLLCVRMEFHLNRRDRLWLLRNDPISHV